jgi:alkylation response protein AidB-like acyl-CoA dehydrogenase
MNFHVDTILAITQPSLPTGSAQETLNDPDIWGGENKCQFGRRSDRSEMDFSWTDAQLALREEARRFASEHLGKNLVERDQRGADSQDEWRADWQKCADFGVFGLHVPSNHGGRNHDVLTTIIALEAIGYGCRDHGLTLAMNGQIWAVQEPLLSFGTDEQKHRYLPGLCNGSIIGAVAMTESEAGSNAAGLTTRATRTDGGYVLNGRKAFVGLGPASDLVLVFASTAPDRGSWGISAFLVETTSPGFTCSPPQQKMGLRTTPMGELTFEDCFINEEARLGREGAGLAIFHHAMEWERSFIFASHVGSMHRQLEDCTDFARKRMVFDQPIDSYQSVSNRLATMKLRLETSQLLLYKAAWLKSQNRPSPAEAALAKLHISEAFVESSLDAIRIHGGRGYLTETGIERDLRDAMAGVIYSGTSDIQRQIIAQLLKS